MIRIGRLTDYGIVIMRYIAARPGRAHNAAEVAVAAHLPSPTVSKLLRILAKEGLLVSHRGAGGGYDLGRPAEEISVADMIRVLEGPIALTSCTIDVPGECEHEPICPVRSHWQHINGAIRAALEAVTLADLAAPTHTGFSALPLTDIGNPGSGSGLKRLPAAVKEA